MKTQRQTIKLRATWWHTWFLLMAFTAAHANATAANPNMIFILVDDLRYDGMGFLSPEINTPHIDNLASNGVYLPNAVVTTSLCSPSRATILTGLSARNHGIVDNNDAPETGLTFFPAHLQKAGYDTAFVGKWHMGRSDDSPRPGFDHWVSFKGQGFYNPTDRIPADLVAKGVRHQLNVNGTLVDQRGYMTDELTDYALDWLRAPERSQDPFFLYLSHKAVHSNVTPAPRHTDQYAEGPIPMPDGPAEISADVEAEGAGKPMWVHNQRNSWHGIDFAYHSDAPIEAYVRRYFATLSAVDDGIGRIVDLLKQRGLLNNTIIVFFSDNGFLFGEHGLIDKRNAYEPSVRVPMLVYGPGRIPAGTVMPNRVRNLDLAPTFLDFGDAHIPEHMEGRSLKPLLTGVTDPQQDPGTDFVYEYYWEWTFPQTPTTFSITRDEIKYIQYHGLWDLEELYDLRKDPEERVNLIDDERYHNALIDRRAALYQALANRDGVHAVPYTERKAAGLRFRRRSGSDTADFPEHFLRDADDTDLFTGFAPPQRLPKKDQN